jgi:hypothetical protein
MEKNISFFPSVLKTIINLLSLNSTVEGFIHWLSFCCGIKKWHSMVPAGSLETKRSKDVSY